MTGGEVSFSEELSQILSSKEATEAYLEEHLVMDLYGAYRFGMTGIAGNGHNWIKEFRALPPEEQAAWRMVRDYVKSETRRQMLIERNKTPE
jgi:hypothetical protein